MNAEQNPYAPPQADAEPVAPEIGVESEFPGEMRRVKTGLTLVYYSICGLLLLMLLSPLLMFGMGGPGLDAMGLMIAAVSFGSIGLMILMFAGQVMCIAVPGPSGAKPLALSSVMLLLGWLLLSLAQVVGLPVGLVVVSVLSNLAFIAAAICFVLFLRKTALFINRDDVAGRATRTLVVGAVATVMVVPGTLLGVQVGPNGPDEGAAPLLLLAGLGGLLMLVAMLMYANTVTYLRKAINV